MHLRQRRSPTLSLPAVIVNTHIKENPIFVDKLKEIIHSRGVETKVVSAYDGTNPLDFNPRCILLSGVPEDADFSLDQPKTQKQVDQAFAWLKRCNVPVLGICYGHQILAHVFGGEVSQLPQIVIDPQFEINLETDNDCGLLCNVKKLTVFAEHKQYISKMPNGFRCLCMKNNVPYVIYNKEKEFYGMQFVPEQSCEGCIDFLKKFVCG